VIAAACEYRRRKDGAAADAFEALDAVNAELTQPHFIQSLFQPTPAARPTFEALLALQAGKPGGVASKLAGALRVLARRSPAAAAIVLGAVALWIAFVVVTVVALAAGGVSTLEIVALVLLAVVSVVALVVLLAAGAAPALGHLAADLNAGLIANGFGMCSGKELTAWLHEKTHQCAGRQPGDPPLTFADLAGTDVDSAIALQLVTTGLSGSRPVDLPLTCTSGCRAPACPSPSPRA
jgi:hypothetical protein